MASEHTLVHEPAAQLAVDGGLPWVEKYRPKSLDELISHQNIIATLEKLIAANQLPHLLLYGPPGTGKTSTILAMARRIFGANYKSMILEVRRARPNAHELASWGGMVGPVRACASVCGVRV